MSESFELEGKNVHGLIAAMSAFPTSNSHRGFSPVITEFLMNARNRFNGLPRRSSRENETVETVNGIAKHPTPG
jgi:hypothetical protein